MASLYTFGVPRGVLGPASATAAAPTTVSFADQFVAEALNLDVSGNDPDQGPISLRELLVHMVEEYARHNGHADLLRERIDGRVGQ